MARPVRQRQPILPYPSRESVTGLVVAIIERKFGFVLPKGLEEYESYYLVTDDATQFSKFRDAIDGAVDVAWPAPWLVRELKEFEQEIAESALEILQATPEGQAILDAMLAIAVYRQRQEGQSNYGR